MIRVTVELHSAITGKRTVLGTAEIANEGTGTKTRGNYRARLLGRRGVPMGETRVENWPRRSRHVWDLLRKVLENADR